MLLSSSASLGLRCVHWRRLPPAIHSSAALLITGPIPWRLEPAPLTQRVLTNVWPEIAPNRFRSRNQFGRRNLVILTSFRISLLFLGASKISAFARGRVKQITRFCLLRRRRKSDGVTCVVIGHPCAASALGEPPLESYHSFQGISLLAVFSIR